jgi:predicted  nucleic acid-binding Zn-ribbon protein
VTKQETVRFLKHEASSEKEKLMNLRDKMMEVSLAQARKLDKIIGKLEDWQNK